MKYAAFFRNVNLGHPRCPDRQQLEAAFRSAGASSATAFQTNGTLVFEAEPGQPGAEVVEGACRRLQAACDLREPVFVRGIDYLAQVVALDPFAAVDPATCHDRFVSFLQSAHVLAPATGLQSPRGDVEVIAVTPAEVLCVNRLSGRTPGSPNAFLERQLASPLTTRTWNTLLRLVQRFA